MSIRSRVTIETGVPMTTADGLTLRADVYRPVGPPRPVLLHRTPYGRHQANYREMAEELASHGYVVVVQDLRGRFDSEGVFLPMWMEGRLDGADGARAVAWSQTISGTLPEVGMYGVSYDASVQWETVALRPAGLRSIYPGGMVADSRSIWPGVFRVGRQLKWYLMLAADTRRRMGLPPPHDRADSDLLWHLEAGKWIWTLPISGVPTDRLGGLAPYWEPWLDRQAVDWYGFADIPAQIPDVAIGLVTGWHDRCFATVELFTAAQAGPPRNAPTELVVGPWTHGYGRPRVVGDVDFGPDAETTFVDQAADWFGRTLRPDGEASPAAPDRGAAPVRLFMMGADRWWTYDRWPVPAMTSTLCLGRHTLTAGASPDADSIPFVYDPADPVPSTYSSDYQDAPIDQRILDGRPDIVRFVTEPLAEPLDVIGAATLVLHASTDAIDTDWHVKLLDVDPDGRAINVATGMVRARWRDGFDAPRFVRPGEIVEYRIPLRPTANRFRPGHRIRLDVTSSDFPNFDRNHNTGDDDLRSAVLRVAHQRIWFGGDHPSRLELPHPIGGPGAEA
jgi:putative CocE/NonD family hydrolase